MIYCVEDDDAIRELMLYSLKTAGFEAKGFSEATGFWKELKETLPDLIILDVMMPGQDGISILAELQKNSATSHVPVIMATAKGTEFDKVQSLDLGADDYLVKPFGMMEMISRIKAVLRRVKKTEKKERLQYGVIELDLARHRVVIEGKKLELTLKEFELLKLLVRAPQRVFTRQELLDKVWGQDFLGETRTVDVHIGTLRQKLGGVADYIKTVRGVGYLLEVGND
ncbi:MULTISPECIES: winged helix-turn-helix domain-containing protein [unclassified Streptococcus]|uniref:winged helix-turn-helix domain-containing protein n=1 Tax=unclassified Streptococcus TaxID=2608887 RepID=UPI001072424D|nr:MULTISPECIES: winged helix-turn-helix domain-containing protein [unclassified Streptococcus]MBF0788255.1 winged helix-turn-helix domain-containing protein [Streptococcus sp. 19428wC2_LYSM12]MCQ9212601.1 winged helix-turn-helix domain-containing protein [Streptococcus sp. B01]MCQ9213940.1 winged helix-turn-helix domain-containing protein [Streptococcus sp. O1]TFV04675.1 response regulator [Streptococcus sp. LYSM12]